ncbi:hypothetical protein LY76DRAFT_113785 [Colletotrichum caudatum]|nr:hypothetical protein LY76DRAFT_113785 [Colletotrichum caudatum]
MYMQRKKSKRAHRPRRVRKVRINSLGLPFAHATQGHKGQPALPLHLDRECHQSPNPGHAGHRTHKNTSKTACHTLCVCFPGFLLRPPSPLIHTYTSIPPRPPFHSFSPTVILSFNISPFHIRCRQPGSTIRILAAFTRASRLQSKVPVHHFNNNNPQVLLVLSREFLHGALLQIGP